MDINLFFREAGSGMPFIFLHGNGEDSSYFENQIDFFSNDYHVFAIDTRGHGNSKRGAAPFTIEQFSEDLYDFMNEKGINSALILGFSDGANIAMKFAIKHQDMVDALILNGGNLYPKGLKTFTQLPVEILYRVYKILSPFSKSAMKKAELYSLMVNDPYIKASEINKISVPTLVIAGKKDMIKDSHTREIADNIEGSILRIIEGDHFIAGRRPKEFNKEVYEFLKMVNTTNND